MADITLRNQKGSALTYTELDNNFSSVNNQLVETESRLGHVAAGMLTDNPATNNLDGSIILPDGQALLYDNPKNEGNPIAYSITGGTTGVDFPALIDNATNYITVWYNGGSPIYDITTDVREINESGIIPYLTVFKFGTEISILDWGSLGTRLPNKLHMRLV